MVRVIWTSPAAADIRDITDYIAFDNPAAARKFAATLIRLGDSLAEFPNRGRPTERGERQLSIVWPYIITDRVVGDSVFIKSVRHGRRRPLD